MARKPLLGLEIGVKKAAKSAIKAAGKVLLERMQENASLTDHTLKDLALAGHPYSQNSSREIHTPNFLVHRQSGDLLDAIEVNQINQFRIQVGVDESVAPHAPYVIFGTSKMVPRDFVTGSLMEVEDEISDIFEKSINEGIKNGGQ